MARIEKSGVQGDTGRKLAEEPAEVNTLTRASAPAS